MKLNGITINYIANAGLLISKGNTKLLIDGIHCRKVPVFSTIPQEVLAKMVTGEGIFKDIDYLLFTHAHKDHFDAEYTLKYINNNKIKAIFATQEACRLMEKKGNSKAQNTTKQIVMKSSYGKKEEIAFNDVRIKYFRITHDGEDYQEVENYGFIIDIDGTFFLHLGDGGFKKEILEQSLIDEEIDYAFLNFPYVNLPQGRILINNVIKPRNIFVIHLPNQEDDLYRYRSITLKVLEKYKAVLPESLALVEPFDVVELKL